MVVNYAHTIKCVCFSINVHILMLLNLKVLELLLTMNKSRVLECIEEKYLRAFSSTYIIYL